MNPQPRKATRARASPGKLLWKAIRAILLGYLGVLVLSFLFQRRLMYYPSGGPVPTPPFPSLREVELSTADGVSLKAWHWPGRDPLTLLIFHGNAGHRGDRLSWAEILRETGAGVFLLDYRGYGGSSGSPTEKGLYLDAEAAAAWLEANRYSPVVYVGESLGSAVAVELALRRPPAALILQSAFTSAADVGQKAYPFLPVRLLIKDRFDSLSKIDRVTCPILLIHGKEDSLVPLTMGRALYDRAQGQKEWLEILGADHNDPLWIDPAYIQRFKHFLEPILRRD